MTRDKAYQIAARRSKQGHCEIFVVVDCDYLGEPSYCVANEFDLDTFYMGAPVVACFVDGQFDYAD